MRWLPHYFDWFILLLTKVVMTFGQFSQLDSSNSSARATTNGDFFPTSKPAPFLAPVMTETCGESFTKFAFVPFLAKENHEIGRLVDFDGGPGWSPFVIVSGNEKALFKVDSEGTIRVAFPFFDTDSDEYHLRLASVNGNLICTVQINVKVAANASLSGNFGSNQTFENNVPIRAESTSPFVFPTIPPTFPSTMATPQLRTTGAPSAVTTTITTTPASFANHVAPMANIFSSANSRDLSLSEDRLPAELEHKNGSKRQGSFGVGGIGGSTIGTYPFSPRCMDPFLTVAVPSDTPPNTPVTKVTATHQVGVPISYNIPDVVFDRFRVDPISGQVFTGPEQLSPRNRPFTEGRVYPQTRSALEFRVRAVIPGGQFCETVIRVNVVPSTGQVISPPVPAGIRSPPIFISPVTELFVSNCILNSPFGQVQAVDPMYGRIQYILDNPNSEVSIDFNTGELRVGSSVPGVPHSRLIIVRAINSDGMSSTQSVTVNFQCRQTFPPPGGMMQFARPNYGFVLTNCNSGTQVNPNERIMLVGNPGAVTFSLSNPQEFSIAPDGVIWLRVPFLNVPPFESRFEVFATDIQGQRAQTQITIYFKCGGVLEPFLFRGPQNFNPGFNPSSGPLSPPRPVDGPALFGGPSNPQFNPGFPGSGPDLGFPRPVDSSPFPGSFGANNPPFAPSTNPGFNPGSGSNLGPPQPVSVPSFPGPFNPSFSPGFSPGFNPDNGILGPNRPVNSPTPFMAISGPNFNFGNPGGSPVPDGLFRPQFPSRLLRPMIQTQEEFQMQGNPMQHFGFALGNPNGKDRGNQQSFNPSDFQPDDPSKKTISSGNTESSANNNKQHDSSSENVEDPNQRDIKNTGTNKQLSAGGFGSSFIDPMFNNLRPGNNFKNFENFENFNRNPPPVGPPFPVGNSNPFPVNSPAQFPPQNIFQPPRDQHFTPPGEQRFPLQPPGFFPPEGAFNPPLGMPNPFSNLNAIPPFQSRINPNVPSLPPGQSPPIFVTPFCAPPGTSFIGRVRALVADPNDRVSYFIWSTGGTDIFDLNSVTGDLRSRVSLGQGVYNVDVAARDSVSRTAIMRLEISITPSCAQPTLGATNNPFFSLDIVTQGATFNPPSSSAPRFIQPSFTFTVPAAAPPRTLIGQVQAQSGSGEQLRYFLSPSGEFEIDPQGRIFNRGFVQVPRTLLVTAVDSRERSATASITIIGPNRAGFPPNCIANDQVPESAARSTLTGALPVVNHFGSVRQLTKSGLSISGPTLITVDVPYLGVLPVTLATGTILGDFNVTGGSGTYRWLTKDDSMFEMTGESKASLVTKSPLQPGSYHHFPSVKDDAGHMTNVTVKIIVRQPDFADNLSTVSIEPFLNRSPQEIDAVF